MLKSVHCSHEAHHLFWVGFELVDIRVIEKLYHRLMLCERLLDHALVQAFLCSSHLKRHLNFNQLIVTENLTIFSLRMKLEEMQANYRPIIGQLGCNKYVAIGVHFELDIAGVLIQNVLN